MNNEWKRQFCEHVFIAFLTYLQPICYSLFFLYVVYFSADIHFPSVSPNWYTKRKLSPLKAKNICPNTLRTVSMRHEMPPKIECERITTHLSSSSSSSTPSTSKHRCWNHELWDHCPSHNRAICTHTARGLRYFPPVNYPIAPITKWSQSNRSHLCFCFRGRWTDFLINLI